MLPRDLKEEDLSERIYAPTIFVPCEGWWCVTIDEKWITYAKQRPKKIVFGARARCVPGRSGNTIVNSRLTIDGRFNCLFGGIGGKWKTFQYELFPAGPITQSRNNTTTIDQIDKGD